MERLFCGLLGVFALARCGDTRECTLEARSSVTVTVADDAGKAIEDAEVTYSLDQGEPKPCENFAGGSYTCGYEIAGRFAIRASKTGFADAEATVTVGETANGCHVEGERLALTLTPE